MGRIGVDWGLGGCDGLGWDKGSYGGVTGGHVKIYI